MKTVIAVLTYRRVGVLSKFLESAHKHCPNVPIAVFEDCANLDNTHGLLTYGTKYLGTDLELEAEVYERPEFTSYLGTRNLGVAGNSNRAIKWFERQKDATHLLLCNDDIEATGDFASEYAAAHTDLKVGLFCFSDPEVLGDEYRGPEVKVLSTKVKLLPQGRQTGCMMSITRDVIERIGYYDVALGRLGQEHVEFNNRATLAGFTNLRGKPQISMDLARPSLKLQVCRSSVSGSERSALDNFANHMIGKLIARYGTETWYRPYRLMHPPHAGAYGGVGIPVKLLLDNGYKLLVDYSCGRATS